MAFVSSCVQISSLFNHGKPVAQVSHHRFTADDYGANLALSRLALSASAEDISDNVAVINGYAALKKRKAETLTMLVIDYKTANDSSTQQILAPLSDKTDFSSLQSVMDKFEATSSTLHNLRLVSATVHPDRSLALPKDPVGWPAALDAQQKHLLAQSHHLEIVGDIKIQLKLIDFFTRYHHRDAAYLSADNVKRLLANAAQSKSLDAGALQNFSAELEAREAHLKESMPYTF